MIESLKTGNGTAISGVCQFPLKKIEDKTIRLYGEILFNGLTKHPHNQQLVKPGFPSFIYYRGMKQGRSALWGAVCECIAADIREGALKG